MLFITDDSSRCSNKTLGLNSKQNHVEGWWGEKNVKKKVVTDNLLDTEKNKFVNDGSKIFDDFWW